MNFWNKEHLSRALTDVEFHNMPEDFSANGLRVHHSEFTLGNIALMKKQGEEVGIDEAYFKYVEDKVSAIMTTDEKYFSKYKLPIIKVKNTRDAVIMMAFYIRRLFEGKVVDITGSCGKSTVTKMCYDVLEQYGASANTNRSNINFSIAWNMTSYDINAKYWVNETSLGGGMELNSYLTKPDVAVITNIAPVHLAPKQTLDMVAVTKAKIFTAMRPNSYAVLYKETDYYEVLEQAAKEKQLNIITVGEADDCDIQIIIGESNYIKVFGKEYKFSEVPTAKHILIDSALTFGVLHSLGLPIEPALEILQNWSPIIGRGQVLTGEFYEGCNITMVDESFNANPLSMTSCLEGFGMTYQDKNKVLIIGDMAEGGVNTVAQHLQLVEVIRKVNPNIVLYCGEQIKVVWDELKREFCGSYYKSVNDLIPELNTWIKDGDCVFVKASHSIELFKITSNFRNSINKSQN